MKAGTVSGYDLKDLFLFVSMRGHHGQKLLEIDLSIAHTKRPAGWDEEPDCQMVEEQDETTSGDLRCSSG
jgi:hypothetical protein